MTMFLQLLQVSIPILISLCAALCLYYVLRSLKKARSAALRTWAMASYPLLIWSVLVFGALVSLKIFLITVNISTDWLQKVQSIFLLLIGFLILLKWKNGYQENLKGYIEEKKIDKSLFEAIGKISSIAMFIISFLSFLEVLEIPITAIVTVGGIGALSLGFAAKDIFANLFAGFMIYLNRPFSTGDLVISPNKHFEGTVEEIGWYLTQLRDAAKCPCYIPNAMLTDAIIENKGRLTHRQIKTLIRLRPEDADKIEKIISDIQGELSKHVAVDQEQSKRVHLVGFNKGTLEIEVAAFTKTVDYGKWLSIQHELFVAVISIIHQHGAELAIISR